MRRRCTLLSGLLFLSACAAAPSPLGEELSPGNRPIVLGIENLFSDPALGAPVLNRIETALREEHLGFRASENAFDPASTQVLSLTGFWVDNAYLLVSVLHDKGEPVSLDVDYHRYRDFEDLAEDPTVLAAGVRETDLGAWRAWLAAALRTGAAGGLRGPSEEPDVNPLLEALNRLKANPKKLRLYESDRLATEISLGRFEGAERYFAAGRFEDAARLFAALDRDVEGLFGRQLRTEERVDPDERPYVFGSSCRSEIIRLLCQQRLNQCRGYLGDPRAKELALIDYDLSKTFLSLSEAAREQEILLELERANYEYTKRYERAERKKSMASILQFPAAVAYVLGFRVRTVGWGNDTEVLSWSVGKLEEIKEAEYRAQRTGLRDQHRIQRRVRTVFAEIRRRLGRFQERDYASFTERMDSFRRRLSANVSPEKVLAEFKELQRSFADLQDELSAERRGPPPSSATPTGAPSN